MKLNKILLVCVTLLISSISNAQTVGIGNNSITVASITAEYAIQLYTGKVNFWPDGQPVVVVVLPREHFVSREFVTEVLGISSHQFYDSLDISINIRKNNAIIRVTSESEVIRNVIKNSGSVGYISGSLFFNYKNELKMLRLK